MPRARCLPISPWPRHRPLPLPRSVTGRTACGRPPGPRWSAPAPNPASPTTTRGRPRPLSTAPFSRAAARASGSPAGASSSAPRRRDPTARRPGSARRSLAPRVPAAAAVLRHLPPRGERQRDRALPISRVPAHRGFSRCAWSSSRIERRPHRPAQQLLDGAHILLLRFPRVACRAEGRGVAPGGGDHRLGDAPGVVALLPHRADEVAAPIGEAVEVVVAHPSTSLASRSASARSVSLRSKPPSSTASAAPRPRPLTLRLHLGRFAHLQETPATTIVAPSRTRTRPTSGSAAVAGSAVRTPRVRTPRARCGRRRRSRPRPKTRRPPTPPGIDAFGGRWSLQGTRPARDRLSQPSPSFRPAVTGRRSAGRQRGRARRPRPRHDAMSKPQP